MGKLRRTRYTRKGNDVSGELELTHIGFFQCFVKEFMSECCPEVQPAKLLKEGEMSFPDLLIAWSQVLSNAQRVIEKVRC